MIFNIHNVFVRSTFRLVKMSSIFYLAVASTQIYVFSFLEYLVFSPRTLLKNSWLNMFYLVVVNVTYIFTESKFAPLVIRFEYFVLSTFK